MIDFYGFESILNRQHLWNDEKEHIALVEKVSRANTWRLPLEILNHVFPTGSKAVEAIAAKNKMSDKIENKYPITRHSYQKIEKMSEEEMRYTMREILKCWRQQYEECVRMIYRLDENDKRLLETLYTFEKKLHAQTRYEVILSGVVSAIGMIALVIAGIISILGREEESILLIAGSILLFAVGITISALKPNPFRIDKSLVPKLFDDKEV